MTRSIWTDIAEQRERNERERRAFNRSVAWSVLLTVVIATVLFFCAGCAAPKTGNVTYNVHAYGSVFIYSQDKSRVDSSESPIRQDVKPNTTLTPGVF